MKKKPHAPAKVALPPRLNLPIREIMTRDVEVIGPDATVREAARKMRDRDVGMLPVLGGDRIMGLVTDRDITVRAIASGLAASRTKIRKIMTPVVAFCYDDEDVQSAIYSMEHRQIRRVLVLNHEEKLVGVLSIGDLAVDTGNKDIAGGVLRKVSEPERVVRQVA
jgi:CBS domain-containing protein